MEEIPNLIPKQNSWETGKAGNRFKIYFEDAKDLLNQIEELKEAGFKIGEDEEKTERELKNQNGKSLNLQGN